MRICLDLCVRQNCGADTLKHGTFKFERRRPKCEGGGGGATVCLFGVNPGLASKSGVICALNTPKGIYHHILGQTPPPLFQGQSCVQEGLVQCTSNFTVYYSTLQNHQHSTFCMYFC